MYYCPFSRTPISISILGTEISDRVFQNLAIFSVPKIGIEIDATQTHALYAPLNNAIASNNMPYLFLRSIPKTLHNLKPIQLLAVAHLMVTSGGLDGHHGQNRR